MFALRVSHAPLPLSVHTDGVVVLTGGHGRTARGLEVMGAHAGRRLLISGVKPGVTIRELAAEDHGAAVLRCCTDLGFSATDTIGNGKETASWAHAHGYRSVRLITSAYHMPRARAEVAARLDPGVAILPDPVTDPQTPGALAREFSKMLARRPLLWLGL